MKELVELEGKHTALLLSILLRIWLVSFLIAVLGYFFTIAELFIEAPTSDDILSSFTLEKLSHKNINSEIMTIIKGPALL